MNVVAFGFPPGTPAGMGIVNDRVLPRLAMVHDVTLVSPNSGPSGEVNGVEIVTTPPVGAVEPLEMVQRALYEHDPDVFFTNQNWQGASQFTGLLNSYYQSTGNEVDAVFYTPMESEEVPPGFADRFLNDHLLPVHVIPFTEPGYRLHEDRTTHGEHYCKTFVPHGIDDVYRGDGPGGGFRSMLGLDAETDLIVTNAGNEKRKHLDDWLAAAGRISEARDDVAFAMHASPEPKRGDPLYGGWELPRIAAAEGLDPGSDVYWTKEYPVQDVPQAQIASMYADADLYMSLSGGEGFGLPVGEALASATPCLLTEHMNHRYVAGDGAEYVPAATYERMRTGDRLVRADVEAAADQAIALLDDPDRREAMGAAGQEHVAAFTWERTARELSDYFETYCQ